MEMRPTPVKTCLYVIALALLIYSCKKTDSPTPKPSVPLVNTIPEFFAPNASADYGKNAPSFTLVADINQYILQPQDLDFDPLKPEQLWIVNHGTINTGGSTVMLTNPGTPLMAADWRQDGNAWHFMLLPTALAFSTNGNWATSPGALDANHNGGRYTGPALWSSNLNIYAMPSAGNGSHLDMVHQSPLSMGIASDTLNKFWVFDGYWGNIVSYDFVKPHLPGGDDHSSAVVHRYTEATVTMTPNIPSHMILDKKTGWLYVALTAEKKIYRLNTQTGSKYKNLPAYTNEPLTEYWEMHGATWEVFADGNMVQPCGIEIKDTRLFVSDYSNGDIIVFDINTKKEIARINTGKAGIMGIKVGPEGKLWYVNATSNEVSRVDPKK
jgi:hypothetical protein